MTQLCIVVTTTTAGNVVEAMEADTALVAVLATAAVEAVGDRAGNEAAVAVEDIGAIPTSFNTVCTVYSKKANKKFFKIR
jgi:hypothetical protein